MPASIPCTTFNNGESVPVLGLGTWKSEPGKVGQAVKDAIQAGYRHIDCAHVYENEKEIGDAIKQMCAEGVVQREELFITSKLWNTSHRPDLVESSLRKTLSNLNLDYLDLYLMHWPMAFKEGDELFPHDASGKMLHSDVRYTDTWPAMEKLVEKGLVKSIGLSNFNTEQIADILNIAKIPPVNNQVECHPWLNQKELKEYCDSKGIILTAYSPLGSPDRPWAKEGEPSLMKDPIFEYIAKRYNNKSVAQILIKYQIQRGLIVVVKSVTKERIIANSQIFDFTLNDEDMKLMNSQNRGHRFVDFRSEKDHPFYPFKDVKF